MSDGELKTTETGPAEAKKPEPTEADKKVARLESVYQKRLAVREKELEAVRQEHRQAQEELARVKREAEIARLYPDDDERANFVRQQAERDLAQQKRGQELDTQEEKLRQYRATLAREVLSHQSGIPPEELEGLETLEQMQLAAERYKRETVEKELAELRDGKKTVSKPRSSTGRFESGEATQRTPNPLNMTDEQFLAHWNEQRRKAAR